MSDPRTHVNARRIKWPDFDDNQFDVYRVCRMEYADLLGIGASKAGGRWNPVGQRAIYTSLDLGTAASESFSHLPKNQKLTGFALMTIRIDGRNFTLLPNDSYRAFLEARSMAHPEIPVLRYESIDDATTADALECRRLLSFQDQIGALMVPSAINPVYNVILFPAYPRFNEMVTLSKVEPHEFHSALDRS